MMEENSSDRKLAVVTGASSGIGFELAREFAKHGFDLLIAAEDEGIFDAHNSLRSMGVNIEPIRVDLSTSKGVDQLYSAIHAHPQKLYAVAINAGVGVGGEFTKTAWEDELNLLQLNVISTVYLTKKILVDFVARGEGRILLTSSIAGEMPGPYYAVYAASKAFIQSFAEAIRYEVKNTGVVITSLQPGATETKFFERADMLKTKAGQSKKDSAEDVARDGFDALMAGKDHVVAGSFMNKVQATVGKVLPETVGAKIHAGQTQPGSSRH